MSRSAYEGFRNGDDEDEEGFHLQNSEPTAKGKGSMVVKGVIAAVLIFFALWNFSKIPFYWERSAYTSVNYNVTECEGSNGTAAVFRRFVELPGMPVRACSGMQSQWNLYSLFGRVSSVKLMSAVDQFLIPHAAMGVSLEVLLVLGLLGGPEKVWSRSKVFLPLVFIFSIHILPAAKGIPDSLTGAPANEVMAALLLLAFMVGEAGFVRDYIKHRHYLNKSKTEGQTHSKTPSAGKLLNWSWLAIGIILNVAPVGEFILMASKPPVDHSVITRPHPMSGQDWYSGLGCPWVGRIFAMGILFLVFVTIFGEYAEARGQVWRSPLGEKGMSIWQICRKAAPTTDVVLYERPELYLEATGECFVLCIVISWTLTSIFNPPIYRDNILRSITGYNNLCVGFDSPPARYVAMPLLVFQAYLAGRYSYLDTVRLNGLKNEGSLTSCQYWFGFFTNWLFASWMLCFPCLLVIVAGFESWTMTQIHLGLFFATLIIMWLMIAGNVLEADQPLLLGTKIWFACFTACTICLPICGVIDVCGFHTDIPTNMLYTIRWEKPKPPVPWPVTALFDYGWFACLLLAVVFLPDAPSVRYTFHCSNKDIEVESVAGTESSLGIYSSSSGEVVGKSESHEEGFCGTL